MEMFTRWLVVGYGALRRGWSWSGWCRHGLLGQYGVQSEEGLGLSLREPLSKGWTEVHYLAAAGGGGNRSSQRGRRKTRSLGRHSPGKECVIRRKQ